MNCNLERLLAKRQADGQQGNVRLWLRLIVAALCYFVVSTTVYAYAEGWTVCNAVFFSVSIALSVGFGTLHVQSTSGALFTCLHVIMGSLILAAGGGLLVRHVVLREDRVAKEEFTIMQTTLGRSTDAFLHNIENTEHRRWRCTRKGKRFLILSLWLATLFCGYVYALLGAYQDHIRDSQTRNINRYAYAMLWTLSTITGLGSEDPGKDPNDLWFATVYLLVSVPLNVTVLASLIDVYVSHVQRNQARQRLLTKIVPTHRTFLDIVESAPEPSSHTSLLGTAEGSSSLKVTYGMYLEYWLRKMPGTEVHAKLLDEIKASFTALDRRGRGFLDCDDLQQADSMQRSLDHPSQVAHSRSLLQHLRSIPSQLEGLENSVHSHPSLVY